MSAEEENLPDKAKTASVATDKNDIPDKSSSVVDDLGKRTRKLTAKGFTMLFEICKKIGNPNLCKLIKLSKGLKRFFLEKDISNCV